MKEHTKKLTIKDEVIQDFLENKKVAEKLGLNCMPTGLLKYYLFKANFSTYAGRIINDYCKQNNIVITRARKVGLKTWNAGENSWISNGVDDGSGQTPNINGFNAFIIILSIGVFIVISLRKKGIWLSS